MSILDGPTPSAMQPQPQTLTPQDVQPAADVLSGQPAQPQQSGFLNDLGVNWGDVPTTNDPADGTHRCFVTKSEIRTRRSDQSKHWVFTYKVADGEPQSGCTKDEWRAIPITRDGRFVSDKDEQAARWLKQRLLSLGVPEDRVGTVTPADVQGTEVYITLKTTTNSKGTFQNVTNVTLASQVPSGPLGSNPQAQQVQSLI